VTCPEFVGHRRCAEKKPRQNLRPRQACRAGAEIPTRAQDRDGPLRKGEPIRKNRLMPPHVEFPMADDVVRFSGFEAARPTRTPASLALVDSIQIVGPTSTTGARDNRVFRATAVGHRRGPAAIVSAIGLEQCRRQ